MYLYACKKKTIKNICCCFFRTTVRIGEYNTKTDEDCEENDIGKLICAPPTQNFEIESAIGHPGFSLEKLQNDVGLIRVKGRIQYSIAGTIKYI